MKKLLLAGQERNRPEILNILYQVGVAHVELADSVQKTLVKDLKNDLVRVERAIEVLEKISPSGSFTPPPGTPVRLIDEFHQYHSRLQVIEQSTSELKRALDEISPWGHIDLADLETLKKAGVFVQLVTCSKEELKSLPADVSVVVHSGDGISYVVTASKRPLEPSSRLILVPIPEKDGYQLTKELEALGAEERHIREHLIALTLRLPDIRGYFFELTERKQFLEIEEKLFNDGPIFILNAWIPSSLIGSLKKAFELPKINVVLETNDPLENETPPTKLENPWWCRPIECLYGALGVIPGYREADISPSFFIFLIVFTAMLIGDGGYALVCLFACLVSYKFITRKGIPPKFLDLFIILFIGTLVFGVFTNTYFGFQPSITKFFMWVDPNSEVGATLLKRFCFYLGAVHLSVGRIWKIKRNPITLSTLSEVGWIIFTWAMLDLVNVLVLSDLGPARMVPMFIVSLILVIFFTAPSWNPISCIGQGIGAVALSAASFLSDIISYIRLWAVGYAGGMLASSFNDLARIAPFAIGVLILILGHGVNIILGLVAIFVHGVRLNLLEFSNHIGMEWSGRNYDPFRKS